MLNAKELNSFLSKVKKSPAPHSTAYPEINGTECWNWTGSQTSNGYGRTSFRGFHYRAHILAKMHWHNYEIVSNLPRHHQQCNHKCHNKLCCNPDHIYIGTSAQNAQERKQGKRLLAHKVKAVRMWWGMGWTQKAIADRLGITEAQVLGIVSGMNYRKIR